MRHESCSIVEISQLSDIEISGSGADNINSMSTSQLNINEQNFFMLVSHGLHHLFGYHHYDKQSRSNMRFLENTLMKLLGLKKVHEN